MKSVLATPDVSLPLAVEPSLALPLVLSLALSLALVLESAELDVTFGSMERLIPVSEAEALDSSFFLHPAPQTHATIIAASNAAQIFFFFMLLFPFVMTFRHFSITTSVKTPLHATEGLYHR
jgi:hypothetical protein